MSLQSSAKMASGPSSPCNSVPSRFSSRTPMDTQLQSQGLHHSTCSNQQHQRPQQGAQGLARTRSKCTCRSETLRPQTFFVPFFAASLFENPIAHFKLNKDLRSRYRSREQTRRAKLRIKNDTALNRCAKGAKCELEQLQFASASLANQETVLHRLQIRLAVTAPFGLRPLLHPLPLVGACLLQCYASIALDAQGRSRRVRVGATEPRATEGT